MIKDANVIFTFTIKIFFTTIMFLSILNAELFDYKIVPSSLGGRNYMNVKILDSKEIRFGKSGGVAFSEISDLAYKDNKLFTLGDKGVLYELNINLRNDKINELDLTNATPLKAQNDQKLDKVHRDAEGLAFMGENLLVSFEREHRIDLYSLNAKKIKNIKINKRLENKDDYQSENKGLEAVAYNEKYGVLTAPEAPLKSKITHTIYSQRAKWKFKADGVIKALEFIDENNLLVLIRDSNKATKKMITVLVRVNLEKCQKDKCESDLLTKMDETDGWNIYNFEGLCKVGENRFLMISDDDEDFSQKTILTLFEITN